MDFKLTEEQQMLQETAERLVRDVYDFESRKAFSESEAGFSTAFWQQLGELGLTAIPFSEELGGFGGTGVETMLIMEQLGKGICLEPYMESVILAGGLIGQLGSDAQKEELLGGIATGELQAAVALDELNSHYDLANVTTTASEQGGEWVLNGRKGVVIGGQTAGKILVSARTAGNNRDEQGISLFVIDPSAAGVTRRVYATVDGRKACELFLDNVQGELLGEAGNAYDAIRYQSGRAIAALCAEAVGAMRTACDLTLEYLKTRKQFGVPIGKFQVLQHRMVDMISELERATSMAILAACLADDEDSAERSAKLAAAKFVINRAGRYVAEQCIQLHGGIAMTWEYNGAHYAKRLVMISHQFGDDDHHLEAYAAQLSVA
ncbi:acyl-CoA/acyl-ACP dehydrogenase [Halopseudomonas aestusnigri]|uniref:acyl-CoA dehydrogenase family protein n=1 Tax=Halopseudomonas aestusnigri TaxID=857252 RepID=UPI000C8E4E30|nr:acyl-CoA dehydrogenase family protein [Halopseudomonas aestusnigri]MAK74696.1 pimeloyl-CoA dehydrogenase small subunit [Pseudomonadales bacterium]HBT57154.1 pimeloyl-CoA dehydrogenase small subunit [Pseudomonas sp.]MAS66596.1 pimeloyl-CoA dehydrogenase small subunit [Pseudomonadales bacterium]MCC4260262.1 acyl-CoA/acyl-ACP dehydrogenase [Halopseudomonas aestusnigri]MCK5531116.1 acyl-CoA dehydrogenase family protein [Halopseudomonas aestusnigri]